MATRDLLEGRFASALRTIAAQMTLEEMHEQRQDYAQRVRATALEGLAQNGLDLEASPSSISTRRTSNSSTAPMRSTPRV